MSIPFPESRQSSTRNDSLRAQINFCHQSISAEGAIAGSWSLERMLREVTDEFIDDSIRSITVPASSEELSKMLDVYAGRQVLTGSYAPDFIEEAVFSVDAGNTWTTITLKFTHEGITVDMCIICSPDDLTKNAVHTELVRSTIFAIDCALKVCDIISSFAPENDDKNTYARARCGFPELLTVTCFLIDHDRDLPAKKGYPPGVSNVNAGVTYFPTNTILVYRKQHANKVLIHEIIHCLGMDSGLQNTNESVENAVKNSLNYKSQTNDDIHAFEAYVEVLACYWHMFLSVPAVVKKTGMSAQGALEALWESELEHFYEVCSHIIEHFCDEEKSEEREELDTSNVKSVMKFVKQLQMEERSHVFSYFFMKTSLWERLDELPVFPNTDTCVKKFWSVFEEAALDGSFWGRVLRSGASGQLSMTTLGW